jgi:hypothetical protein
MLRLFKRTILTVAILGAANSGFAFALLGPLDPSFMTVGIGYGLPGDLGGPMNLGEGYRWNVKTIYYGFDPSFIHYFGTKGSNAVVQALTVINNLPAMSKLSADLREFPTDTRRVNFRASSLGIIDLKSYTLAFMMEELGLASPERYAWTLRNRTVVSPTVTTYVVVQRNFDPVTMVPSPYVNDTLYYYAIVDPIPLNGNQTYADAIELPVDPLQSFTTLATASDSIYGLGIFSGSFFTGLTRDDVGGLRYLYRKGLDNAYYEGLVTNATASGGGGVFTPVGGSNSIVNIGLRSGVDKIMFKAFKNESGVGNFIAFTNSNQDAYYTNSHLVKQTYGRGMIVPDIIFSAQDLPIVPPGNFPPTISRSIAFINNSALNAGGSGTGATAGPGNISPSLVITFNKVGPFFFNQTPTSLDQATGLFGFVWGSYDGRTNDPVVYPAGLTIQDLQQIIFAP